MRDADERTIVVCFKPGAGRDFLPSVLRTLGIGGEPSPRWRWYDPGLLTVKIGHEVSLEMADRLRDRPEVKRLLLLPAGERMVSRRPGRPDSVVTLPNGAKIGGKSPIVIAGPCSVESESQACEVAAMVKDAGAGAFRGGAFKPRTDPYSFGGLGEQGLKCLARAREVTGLPIVTEVPDTDHLDIVADYADVIQIGSRNMHSFPLLFTVGSHRSGKPILLKRGFGATIDEFLLAAEYILLGRFYAGIEDPGIILCERGIRTFETSTRFTMDVGAIAVLKERTHLPVIADPSHAAGDRNYVLPLARAVLAAGSDGLLVEAHTDPLHAWSDANQSLGPEEFRSLMSDVGKLASLGLNRRPL